MAIMVPHSRGQDPKTAKGVMVDVSPGLNDTVPDTCWFRAEIEKI